MKKSLIRIMCFLMILIMILCYTNRVFKVKYGDGIYGLTTFYELEENTVDVLLLGSSHAFEDFNTGTLWSEYGIASFMLGGSVQPLWNTYYYLKEALKTQKPELIVLEGYMTANMAEYSDDSRIIKNNFGLKWSKDKVDSVKISAPEERWDEFLLEYTQYHTRYTELSKADFLENQGDPLYDDWKGFGCNMATTPFPAPEVKHIAERLPLQEKTESFYRQIIELTQKKQIPLLIVITPYAGISAEEQMKYNTAGDIAAEYNVPFINYNLLYEEVELDFQTDAADEGHLNYIGNQKLSMHLGKYISDQFQVSDRRENSTYETWERDAAYIEAMIRNHILAGTYELDAYLSHLQNDNYFIILSLDGNASIEKKKVKKLFETLQIETIEKSGMWYRNNLNKDVGFSGEAELEHYIILDDHDFCMRRTYDLQNQSYYNTITVDNEIQKKVMNGINIVVYDRVTKRVADVVGLNADDKYRMIR